MNLDVKRNLKVFFDKYFWRQHPEAAIRYYPVVKAITRLKLDKAKILEVGPGSLGIIPYFQREIDGVDIDFSGPKTNLLNKIIGTATNLPFKKNFYDVVISVDVLEHIPKEQREVAIEELIRVAKKLAVIVVPTGEKSQQQDSELSVRWQKMKKGKNQFLEEHVQNGLPSNHEILVTIDKALRKFGKKAKIKSTPNLNLLIRSILMKSWISKSKLMYAAYMKGFLLLLPILHLANFGNCYRTVVVIEFSE